MKQQESSVDRFRNWVRNSVMLKLITITILMLLLLIPASMVKSIIQEREYLSNNAVNEVSSKWAGAQKLQGPFVTIPVVYEYQHDDKPRETIKYLNILPNQLLLDGQVRPERLNRGIYEIVVYKSNISVQGDYIFDVKIDENNLKEIRLDQAFLTFGLSDLRGIEEQIEIKWNGVNLKVEPGSRIKEIVPSGITVDLPPLTFSKDKTIPFSFDMKLQGSRNMSFVPLGMVTEVGLKSDWDAPSFNGNFLPDEREVNDNGFTANWKILQLNRNFPQYWFGNTYVSSINNSSFGVDLKLPLDDYQKAMRSAKYGVMTITLTFLIFFLVEILNKRKIHPFQYALVGLALLVFYILLISISEHTNFNVAYAISTFSIVTIITLYSLSVFKVKRLTMILVVALTAIYGFLFVTLQLADYALLMGSIGLLLILAATMYFTRHINWYQLQIEQESD